MMFIPHPVLYITLVFQWCRHISVVLSIFTLMRLILLSSPPLSLSHTAVGFLLTLVVSVIALVLATSAGAPVVGFAVLVSVGSLLSAAVLAAAAHFALARLTGRVEVGCMYRELAEKEKE